MTKLKTYFAYAKKHAPKNIDHDMLDRMIYELYKQYSNLEALILTSSDIDPMYLPMYDEEEITQEINISDIEGPDLDLHNDFFKCECGADSIDSPYHSNWCPKHSVT